MYNTWFLKSILVSTSLKIVPNTSSSFSVLFLLIITNVIIFQSFRHEKCYNTNNSCSYYIFSDYVVFSFLSQCNSSCSIYPFQAFGLILITVSLTVRSGSYLVHIISLLNIIFFYSCPNAILAVQYTLFVYMELFW